jgi:hypothetical protein
LRHGVGAGARAEAASRHLFAAGVLVMTAVMAAAPPPALMVILEVALMSVEQEQKAYRDEP